MKLPYSNSSRQQLQYRQSHKHNNLLQFTRYVSTIQPSYYMHITVILHIVKQPLNLNPARCYKVRYIALAILCTKKFKLVTNPDPLNTKATKFLTVYPNRQILYTAQQWKSSLATELNDSSSSLPFFPPSFRRLCRPPPPPYFIFWLSFHFSRGQDRKFPSSVFLCSETKRKRLLCSLTKPKLSALSSADVGGSSRDAHAAVDFDKTATSFRTIKGSYLLLSPKSNVYA